jgi:hypothetical protein
MPMRCELSYQPALRGSRLRNAFAICFSFNVIDRLADAFGFRVPVSQLFDYKQYAIVSRAP